MKWSKTHRWNKNQRKRRKNKEISCKWNINKIKFLIAALGHHRWYVSWYVCDNPIWLSIFLYGIPGVTFDLSLTPILYDPGH